MCLYALKLCSRTLEGKTLLTGLEKSGNRRKEEEAERWMSRKKGKRLKLRVFLQEERASKDEGRREQNE